MFLNVSPGFITYTFPQKLTQCFQYRKRSSTRNYERQSVTLETKQSCFLSLTIILKDWSDFFHTFSPKNLVKHFFVFKSSQQNYFRSSLLVLWLFFFSIWTLFLLTSYGEQEYWSRTQFPTTFNEWSNQDHYINMITHTVLHHYLGILEKKKKVRFRKEGGCVKCSISLCHLLSSEIQYP